MTTTQEVPVRAATVLLFGPPNVGKSALFGAMTGRHANVSNYPGTTVSVSRGSWRTGAGGVFEVLDTPGAYSMLPITDEERVARDALFSTDAVAVLHVVDAKNLDRSLATTLELLDAGMPVVLVLNMSDEAEDQGIEIDAEELSERIGCPVVRTVAVRKRGLTELARAVESVGQSSDARQNGHVGAHWIAQFGPAVDELAQLRASDHSLPMHMTGRLAATYAIRGSKEIAERAGFPSEELARVRREVRERVGGMPPVAAITGLRHRSDQLLDGVFERHTGGAERIRHRLGRLLAHPLWGLPALFAVLYFGFYQLVGVFAAGEVVGWLEETLFGGWINPWLNSLFEVIVPWDVLRALFVGEYGLLTLGITYALALVLPVVGAFFILFSMVEDSGYFPRLALLCDRIFKRVGLNGRAVITMVLGFGCSTMATVTTRSLETKKERVLATLLLVMTIPCSAQLGLITALLAAKGFSLWLTYALILVAVFLGIGWITARLIPGQNATFHMEVAPLRMPRIGPVLRKTGMRLFWYFKEVVPLFLMASVILWALDQSTALVWVQGAMEPMMSLIGMPVEAAESFLIGFFRRDFGAAGLFELAASEETGLTDRQMLTGAVTLTLFVPCIATFMIMVKERGRMIAAVILAVVTAIALGVGAVLNQTLLALGWL